MFTRYRTPALVELDFTSPSRQAAAPGPRPRLAAGKDSKCLPLTSLTRDLLQQISAGMTSRTFHAAAHAGQGLGH